MARLRQEERTQLKTTFRSVISQIGAAAVIMAGINGVLSVVNTDYEMDDYDGQTVQTCSGNFYDSGGSGSRYNHNEDYTVSFCSDNGDQVQMDFTTFDLPASGDYLYVYDGADTSAARLGIYKSSELAGAKLISSGTCLTFRFVSDATGKGNGWDASISCVSVSGSIPISSFPYSEGFELGEGAWSQAADDDHNWWLDYYGTPSSRTGPSSAQEGYYYMYVEASSPYYPSKKAHFLSPVFDLTEVGSASFSFYYSMYGSSMGSMELEASTDGGIIWNTLWSKSGNQGSSWNQVTLDLAAYLGTNLRLRYVGTTGSSFRGDMAIDNIVLTALSQNLVLDTDNDGVLDINDLDDDNDGLTDIDEKSCGSDDLAFDWGNYFTNNANVNPADQQVNLGDVQLSFLENSGANYREFSKIGDFSGMQSIWVLMQDPTSTSQKGIYKMIFSRPVDGVEIVIGDIDKGAGAWQDLVTVKGYVGSNLYSIKNSDILLNTYYTSYQGSNLFMGQNPASGSAGNVEISFPNQLDSIIITYEDAIVDDSFGDGTGGQLIGISDFRITCPNRDTDGDGLEDYRDLDSDNDGIPDLVEAGGVDTDGNGIVDVATDTDGDGLVDIMETANGKTTILLDPDGDGTNEISKDNDGDQLANWIDLDSDNDGLLDVVEAGGNDMDRNGLLDGNSLGANGYNNLVDPTDGGTPMIYTTADDPNDADTRVEYVANSGYIGDTDGDDVPDFADVDSDNDGIYDIYEAQPSNTFKALVDTDTDIDGVDNTFDDKNGFGGNGAIGLTPVNTDQSDLPDYRDTDSDDDYVPDLQEAWDNILDGDSRPDLAGSTEVDTDGDGLVDGFDDDASDPTVSSMIGMFPPDDDGGTGSLMPNSMGIDPSTAIAAVDIFPGNKCSGTKLGEVDFRAESDACVRASISYAMTDPRYAVQCMGDLGKGQNINMGTDTLGYNRIKSCVRFDKSQGKAKQGAGSTIVRATAFCLKQDDWYRFYNPAEPEHFLFAIKNGTNTVPLDEAIDYVEIELKPYGPESKANATNCFMAMERSWKVVQKAELNGTVSIRFFFEPREYNRLIRKANQMASQMRATPVAKWYKTASGVDYENLPTEFNELDQDSLVDLNNKGGSTSANSTDKTAFGNNKNYVQFDDITSFSGGTMGVEMETSSNLPVEWLGFDVTQEGNDGKLAWATAKEINADRFEVERSMDGMVYEQIGNVKAAGTTDVAQEYSFRDQGVVTQGGGIFYYRLRQVDFDGQFEYSKTVELTLQDVAGTLNMKVFPNPASEVATVQTSGLTDQTAMLRIYSAAGQQVYVAEMNSAPTQQVPVGTWTPGTYMVIVSNGTNRVSKRLVVTR